MAGWFNISAPLGREPGYHQSSSNVLGYVLGVSMFLGVLLGGRIAAAEERARTDVKPIAGMGSRPPGTWNPIVLTWGSGTIQWRGQFGRREIVTCPPGGHLEPVFGTDIYTDDSSICSAALHAGLLKSTETGGTVVIEVRPDPSQYLGSVRNGVASQDWFDHWPSSFIFVLARTPAGPVSAIQAEARTSAESWPDAVGRVLTFACPPRVELLSVFGTEVYTDDSPICSAAVHAGRMSHEQGGMVSIVVQPGQPSYQGSSQHGVQSMTAESRLQSYAFTDTPSTILPPPTLTTPFIRPDGSSARFVPID